MDNLLTRVPSRPDVFGGKPIIRDMRISVEMILSLLEPGETEAEILADFADLEVQGISACIALARGASQRLLSRNPDRRAMRVLRP